MTPSRIATFGFLFVFSLGMYGLAFYFRTHAADNMTAIALPAFFTLFGTLLILATIAGVRSDKKEARDKIVEDDAIKKLEQAALAGYELAHEKDEPLNRDDYRNLNEGIKTTFIVTLLFASIFIAIGYSLSPYAYIGVGVSLIPLVMGLINIATIKRNNVKTVLRGFVTERLAAPSTDSDHHTTYTYYIKVGKRQFLVDTATYRRYLIGKLVEIHFIDKPVKVMGIKTNSYFIISKRILPQAN